MINYYTYNSKGIITETGLCDPETFKLLGNQEGVTCKEGIVDMTRKKVDMTTGLLVDYSPKPPQAYLREETRVLRAQLLQATDWIELPSNKGNRLYAPLMEFRAAVKAESKLAIAENRLPSFPVMPT